MKGKVNCTMSVRKLSSGKWIASLDYGYTWQGKRDRRSKTCKTKREAINAERAMIIERDGSASERITFAEFLDLVYWPQKTKIRANTRRGYERDIKLRLMPRFGQLEIGDINRFTIQQMINSCATKKVATNARETLSSILSVAVEMGMLATNPASYKYQYPDASNTAADNYGVWLTSFAAHRELIDYVSEGNTGDALERMVVLGLCFGLRKGEIFGLDWSNVDFARREIRITQTYTVAKGGATINPPKTPKAKRTIPMTGFAYDHMSSWQQVGAAVVVGVGGRRMHPNTGSNKMRKMVKDCYADGTPLPEVTIHSLRHSFATACINAGIEVSKVSAWLGHRDTSTTYNRYVKPTLSDLRGETAVIDAAYETV